MKFRRKPVVRDVVDALKGDAAYTVQRENGALVQVPIEEFERDYEPAKRDYVKKTRIKKAKKATEQP